MLYYTYKIEGAERMKKIVKDISNHPLWLWRLTLLNHLGLIVYIYIIKFLMIILVLTRKNFR